MQDAMDVADFARSEQAVAGGALLDAYRSGSADSVRQCASGPLFCDLDNQARPFLLLGLVLGVVQCTSGPLFCDLDNQERPPLSCV